MVEEKRSFWQTIPGILTGVAGILTAIAGLVTALYSTGVLRPHHSEGTKAIDTLSTPSPDEKMGHLAYSQYNGHSWMLFVSDADGSGRQAVPGVSGTAPSWSADGRLLAMGGAGPQGQGIYLYNFPAGPWRFVTEAGRGAYPALSHDGKRIAFCEGENIVIVNADGSDKQQVTSTADASWPSWSPGSKQVAFERGRGGERHIWTSDFVGMRQLTSGDMDEWGPSWSPDGRWIAYNGEVPKASEGVYLIGSDGAGGRLLAPDGIYPTWSPDSKWVGFQKRIPCTNTAGAQDLCAAFFRIRIDGGPVEQVMSFNSQGATMGGPIPRWGK